MDQNGPFWSILFILVHLGPPTVLWPFLSKAELRNIDSESPSKSHPINAQSDLGIADSVPLSSLPNPDLPFLGVLIFLSLFSPDIPAKIPGYPAKKFGFPVKDIPNFLAPTPSHGKPLPHPKMSGPRSLGLGSIFFPDSKSSKNNKNIQRTFPLVRDFPLKVATHHLRRFFWCFYRNGVAIHAYLSTIFSTAVVFYSLYRFPPSFA